MGAGPAPAARAWDALVGPLGLAGAAEGQRVRTAAGAPPLAGVVERVGPSEYPELLLRLEEPAPGIAHLFALPMAGQIFLPIRIYLYGEGAQAAAARDEPLWQAWMAEWFPRQ
ncbi:hypothetical protein WMF39_45200 [Sorangium sp. So ce1504]|uniref:hypothetical protein n=1 Tax=Sorangium sp. So ce1504 TaxID=3133337 RepID=UPI003F63E031